MPETCPVADQAEVVSATAQTLVVHMRKLRRLQRKCAACPQVETCQLIERWRGLINRAVQEINAEWQT